MNAEMGARLVEERKRIGLTQQQFFLACGISKAQQYNFEKGINSPGGAYLIAADHLGVDVLYVLTGRRGNPRTAASATTARASRGGVAVAGANNKVTVAPSPRRKK